MVDLHPMSRQEPTIALLPWGNVLEDVLDPLGVSLETFCNEFRGSWMFGYVDALRLAGVRTVVVWFSTRVTEPSHFIHAPTGATVCILPAPNVYRRIRQHMLYPYGQTVKEAYGEIRGRRRILLPGYALFKEIVLYLTTPPRLVARELRRHGCRAILCHEYEYPRFDTCLLLGKLLRLPVFATFQGGFYHHSRLERFIRPITVRACASLIIATQSEAHRVRARYGLASRKLARIFNPIDTDVWQAADRQATRVALRIPAEARVAVWHGRVSVHKKGLDILLDAWERVCRHLTHRDVRLLLIGSGDGAEELDRRLAAAHLPGIVWINEFLHDPLVMRRYLSAGDVYAFASRYEGFPVAPIEAMACGLPLVATDADGIPDILEGGEAAGGLMVPRNDVAALAQALSRVLDNEAWGRELGKRARCRVENSFSLHAIGRQLRTLLLTPQDHT